MKALVLGSTGYAGMMLLRILLDHPHIESVIPASRSAAGKALREMDPAISESAEPRLVETGGRYVDPATVDPSAADVVFSALPHKTAAEVIGPLVGPAPVIDLSADFRFRDISTYEKWYTNHPFPALLEKAVYGLTEWHREEISSGDLIACPGCYPTCVLLPLLPFAGHVSGTIVSNALTGMSGAGRKAEQNLLFNERSESVAPYSPGRTHRHVPEIEQALVSAGLNAELVFTPHLVPIKQGMLVTTVADLIRPLTQTDAEEIIRAAYKDTPFVGLSARNLPDTRDVRNTNRCDISVQVQGNRLILFSVIDNLYKGASGQAVQNMNLRFGFDEVSGLRQNGEF
jgi:N-acetyl-gamma-glutamyl-phosphate reductase